MKRRLILLVLTSLFIFSFVAYAEEGDSQQVPVQAYEQASSDAAPSDAATATTAPNAATTAKTTTKAQTVPAPPTTDNSLEMKTLQAQLAQLNQNAISFQQKMDEKILLITNQMNTNQTELQRLEKALMLLDQEVQALQQKPGVTALAPAATTHPRAGNSFKLLSFWEQRIGRWGVLVAMIVVLVILIFLTRWVLLKKGKRKEDIDAKDDTQGEYDYMGSEESIPAKLNLARAYIKMEDYEQAETLLREVIKKGSKQQQQEAQVLLDQCQ